MGKLTDTITSLLAELPLTVVQRERLQLAKDRIGVISAENVHLKAENARLEKQLGEADRAIADHAVREEFVEHRGALFKRRNSEGYHECVYCLNCHRPMSALRNYPFHCTSCRVELRFTGDDLERVMGELPE